MRIRDIYQLEALAAPPELAAAAPLPAEPLEDDVDELLVLLLEEVDVLVFDEDEDEDELAAPPALELPPDVEPPLLVVDVDDELPATVKLMVWPPWVRTTTVRMPLPLKLKVCVVLKLPLAEPNPTCTGWFAVTITVVQPLLLVVATDAWSVVSVVVVLANDTVDLLVVLVELAD